MTDDVSREEEDIVETLFKKYDLTESDIPHVEILQIAVMSIGFGRNHRTAEMLRFVADMIESPIKPDPDVAAKNAAAARRRM